MSPVTTPANAMYTYWVQQRQLTLCSHLMMTRFAGHILWGIPSEMKPPGSQCTTRFKRERVTGGVSQQSVLVNGIPHHICDLLPALETGHSVTNESDESFGDKLSMDGTNGLPQNVTASSLNDSEAETVIYVPLRMSTLTKKPPPPCIMCDPKSRGESSSHRANLRQKRIRVMSQHCLSETYGRGRECLILFHPLF